MKKYLFLAAACLSFAFTACSDDNTQDEGENTAPTCKITEPLEGETYDANLPLTIKGRINDKENNVSAVTNALVASHMAGCGLYDTLQVLSEMTLEDCNCFLREEVDVERMTLSIIAPAK